MRIIETDINDIEQDISKSKKKLIGDIVSFVQPLFSKDYHIKIKEIKELKKTLIDKKNKIKKEKIELESLLKQYNKKDKERQLLSKFSKLIQNNLIQESMKGEMSIMLKSFDNISEEKLISYLNETVQILSQKFGKN